MTVQKSRKHPGNLCEHGSQGKGGEFAAAPSFGLAAMGECKRPIPALRLTKTKRSLSGVTGSQALRIFLLGAVFAFSDPLSINQWEVHAQELGATSAASMIGGWWRFLVRPHQARETSPGLQAEEPPMSPPGVNGQTPDSESPPQDSGNAAQLMPLPAAEAPESGNPPQDSGSPVRLMSLPPLKAPTPDSANPPQESGIPTPTPPAAHIPRPLDKISQYLWSVYQRSATKRDSSGDFTWKDEAAAARLGLLTQEYVIGGMDPDFRELLYNLGHAMDAAGINWTILSAFRDDYRQGVAAGFKAHRGYSFHGGSIATGGYGHGCAADLEGTDGNGDSNDAVWKWLDQHGEHFGIYRPMRKIDPAHVQPVAGWHERAADLRDRRIVVQKADLPSGTANTAVEKPIYPVVASHAGVTEAQFECERSHHHPAERLRVAGTSSHLRPRFMFDRTHRHHRWRMLAEIPSPQKHGGTEASPDADELQKNGKAAVIADRRTPKNGPATEPALKGDENHSNRKPQAVADGRTVEKRQGAETLNTDELHRSDRRQAVANIHGPHRRLAADALLSAHESHRHGQPRTVADVRDPQKPSATEAVLNTDDSHRDESHRSAKWRTAADIREKRRAAEPSPNTDGTHRNAKWRTLADIRSLQKRSGPEPLRRHARLRGRFHFVGPIFDAAPGRRS